MTMNEHNNSLSALRVDDNEANGGRSDTLIASNKLAKRGGTCASKDTRSQFGLTKPDNVMKIMPKINEWRTFGGRTLVIDMEPDHIDM